MADTGGSKKRRERNRIRDRRGKGASVRAVEGQEETVPGEVIVVRAPASAAPAQPKEKSVASSKPQAPAPAPAAAEPLFTLSALMPPVEGQGEQPTQQKQGSQQQQGEGGGKPRRNRGGRGRARAPNGMQGGSMNSGAAVPATN